MIEKESLCSVGYYLRAVNQSQRMMNVFELEGELVDFMTWKITVFLFVAVGYEWDMIQLTEFLLEWDSIH